MRCPECQELVKPDAASCPACGGALRSPAAGDGSLIDKYSRQIAVAGARWNVEAPPELPLTIPHSRARAPQDLPAPGRTPQGDLAIEAQTFGVLNLLLLHGGFSPFLRLGVRCREPELLAGTSLRITGDPEAVRPTTLPLTAAGRLEPPALSPDYDTFFALDEAVAGHLDLALLRQGRSVIESSLPVTVQNPNEWINQPGCEAALAGLITPNAPAVAELIEGIGLDFVAYQSPSAESVRREIAAVHEALRRLDLSYIGVPPSFEGTGQKVLFPDEVLRSRRGCCIDLAVLNAALLERVGYSPLIFFVRDRERGWGHAFCGVWTSTIRAREPVLRDRGVLLSAVTGHDLLVWNSTTMFDRGGADCLSPAMASGVQLLEHFEFALDVGACRAHGYKPVPRKGR